MNIIGKLCQINQKTRNMTQINKIRNEKWVNKTETNNFTKISRKYFKTYSNKLENFKGMDKFLDTDKLPKLK
jgi:predicted nucleotide-binding protein (sugar kinase/HSP70/actin superfamily)